MNPNCTHSLVATTFLFCGIGVQAQWQPVGDPGSAYAVEVHNDILFAGNQGGAIRKSIDHGDTWTDANTGITDASNWWLDSEGGYLFCGTQSGAAFRSADDGASWQNIGLSSARGFAEHNDTLYVCQWYSGGVDRSSDGGLTWYNTGSISGAGNFWPLISANGYVFLGAQTGGIRRIANSTDAWTAANTGLGSTEVYAFEELDDVLFAGTGISGGAPGGVYRSVDNGNIWTASGLNGQLVYALHAKDGLLFAGTANAGVYMSSDSGATWTAFNDGLTNQQVVRLISDDEYLYAGTFGGVYRYGINTGLAEADASPIGISAYPVPCEGSVTTTLQLGKAADVTAQLLDITGKVVAQRREGHKPAGSHLLQWDMEAFVPGLYTCRVLAGDGQGTVRVVVQR